MGRVCFIGLVVFFLSMGLRQPAYSQPLKIDFYGDTLSLPFSNRQCINWQNRLSEESIEQFYNQAEALDYESLVATMFHYRTQAGLDDWLYYQLVRKVAQVFSPKEEDYNRYTLYKWYFLMLSGYDAELAISGDTVLFYVQSDELIYDIPYHTHNGKQYVCLNYHDYSHNLDFAAMPLHHISIRNSTGRSFSYKLTNIPQFKPSDYQDKNIEFDYGAVSYHFKVKVNNQLKSIYANYPTADYGLYFNAPMSRETYDSFMPKLKSITRHLSTKHGIEYLMRFTRYAFLYQPDKEAYGGEKRLSPEQTLLSETSDCEDRSALFFFLVKEIYNLPMIVLVYPGHVTIAVKLEKGHGKPIVYNGDKYYVCEPSPQAQDLNIGQLPRAVKGEAYEVVYAWQP